MRYLISLLLVLTFATAPAFAQDAPDAGTATPADVVAPAPAPAAVPEADVASPVPVADPAAPAATPVVVPGPVEVTETAPVAPPEPAELAVPETDEEAGALIGKLLDAANNGHWTIFGGLLILLLMFGFNRLGLAAKIGTKWVPWVTLATGGLVGIAVGLAEGAALGDALKLGLLEGGLAIALWELVAKHVTKTKSDGTPRVPETPTEA